MANMTTLQILQGIKTWVTTKLNLKQDVINDLANIRSGAQAGSTAVQPAELSAYFNDASYDNNTHRINFYHGQTVVAYVDASPFIIDGMVDDVRIENGYLVIDFNTASGKQDISIPLTDIFNPNNYYNKTQTDGLLSQKQDVIQDLSDIRAGASAGSTAVQPSALKSYSTTNDMNTAIANAVNTEKERALGVEQSLQTNKQDKLTFDNIPTKGSTNPVTSNGIALAIEAGQAEPHEKLTVTATGIDNTHTGSDVDTGSSQRDVTLTVTDSDTQEVIAQGTNTLTVRIRYGRNYTISASHANDYLTPAAQSFTAEQIIRDVQMAYTWIPRDVITLDQTISDDEEMISGDVRGTVIQAIRSGSHLYLGIPQTQEGDEVGTELICQLDDEDATKYAEDGSTAALDGSEGDQWMKLPVFWWRVIAVGEADEQDSHDQYKFAFAIDGEPSAEWHKWEGDRNLLGAKEMKVVDGVGRSVSGGTSTGSFTKATGESCAEARGLGNGCVTWEWQWMMCTLFFAWAGRTNSQAENGIGSNTYSRTLGVTDTLGMTDTTPAQATSMTSSRFWGLEAWWNCKTEWIGRVTMSDYVLTIRDMNTGESRTVSGFIKCGGTGGWTSRMKITDKMDYIPVEKDATETTSYCDWVNSNSGSRVLNRSGVRASAHGGVASVSANNAPSSTYANVGSRLAFNGVVAVAESVAAFKAAIDARSAS